MLLYREIFSLKVSLVLYRFLMYLQVIYLQ
nr:MAG TPA: hypothetical protein [Bacteriophage sp.]